MAAEADQAKRVDIGFSGGQVLVLEVPESVYRELREALEGRDGGSGWHEFEAEDSRVAVDLAEVVYVRLDTEEHRVGF